MSYILDALKKSEQEHKKGQVPGLGTIQGLPGPGGRFETDRLIWIYSLATILLAAVVVGAWLYLREPAPTTAPVEVPTATITQLPVDSRTATTKAETKPATTPANPKTARPKVVPPITKAESPQSQPLLKAVAPEVSAPSSPATPTPVIAKPPSPPVRVEETAQERPPSEGNSPEDTETEVNPEQLVTVPFEELPAETRANIPAIKIGVHLFGDTPAARRASINGRLMREGQQVDKDLVLVEIIRQGVILSYRGRKFTMLVFPR